MRLLSSQRSSPAALSPRWEWNRRSRKGSATASAPGEHFRVAGQSPSTWGHLERNWSNRNLQPDLRPASWMRRESDAPKLAWNKCGDKWRWGSANGKRRGAELAVIDRRESQWEGGSRCSRGKVERFGRPLFTAASAGEHLRPSATISGYNRAKSSSLSQSSPKRPGCT